MENINMLSRTKHASKTQDYQQWDLCEERKKRKPFVSGMPDMQLQFPPNPDPPAEKEIQFPQQ